MNYENYSCCSHGPGRTAAQSLAEMELERGLWGAARDGELPRVRALLAKGYDPNRQDPYGYTALHYAARAGKAEVVSELLSHGGCPTARTNGGATPAHRAAYKGHKEVLDLLLAALRVKGVEHIVAVDDDGDTIAHKAAKGGHTQLAGELVRDFPLLDSMKNQRGYTWSLMS
ncbi:ankyrin repeat domain-containing protein 39-like [Tropilaelaps mercedesae]|uniref:Ankyrin repeat domain-containing protein 39-like n=1 Tax=Tropilaelaps mercedesae TaxID=418985 RepID=A0A1V9XKX3_9ACAR|nr:ankyrin repeat domain-containing protein 39-like [Tropilaelaps mercedesae]